MVVTEPGYPVAERARASPGRRCCGLPLLEENAFLPDLDALDRATLARVALFWVNYPNNPTGAVATLAFYERLAALAREHGFLLGRTRPTASSWFREPPASALQAQGREHVVVGNTLSKRVLHDRLPLRFRGGLAGGDRGAEALSSSVGTAPQGSCSACRWRRGSDEAHVERARERYRRSERCSRAGSRPPASCSRAAAPRPLPLGARPGGATSEAFAERLLRHGLVVTPG